MLYFTSLPRFTIPLQLHHHTVRYVPARGHNPSTSTSPYCALRFCPGSQSFYKYFTILCFTFLPGVTISLQVYYHTVLFVSARGHNPATSTSPCCTLRLCLGSQSFYKNVNILYFTSLTGITISLQVHHHTVLYASVRGHNPFTCTSPYIILGHRLASHYCCNCITILVYTLLPWATLLRQVHHHSARYVTVLVRSTTSKSTQCTLVTPHLHAHHTVFYVTVRGHNSSAHHHTARYATDLDHSSSISKSSRSTSLPFANLFCKCITIPHCTSLPWTTLPLQVLHFILHSTTLLWFALFRHNHAQRHCPYET